MDDTNTTAPPIEPSHTADAPVLHWSLSVVLLSLACAGARIEIPSTKAGTFYEGIQGWIQLSNLPR